MSLLKIHNARFYMPEPHAIQCMALQPYSKKLALSRSDARIEIWNLNYVWFIERTITSTVKNFSVDALGWYNDRLFSVGLHGFLIEYDLYKLAVKSQSAVTGETACCLDIKNNKIAVGTEKGYLNIFTIEEDEVCFEKFLDKQEGRIICLKFDESGEFIVSGSIDVIRIWNVESGHAIHKMTTGRSEANIYTVVWCLVVTSDFTVISGDSRGKITFWDGKMGSQLESHQSHKADILALCLSEDQNTICCAGVDPNIVNYVKINVKGGTKKWVKSIQRKIHEHDVHSLIIHGNKLYSGGADSYLACSFHPPKTLLKMPPILQTPCACVSTEARFLMLRYPRHLEVWHLGEPEDAGDDYRGMLSLKGSLQKLLVLEKISKNDDDCEEEEGVLCSCISNDGKWIMFSTCLGIRLFQLDYADERPSLLKVGDLERKATPCVQAIFTPDSSHLVTAPNSGGLVIYDLKDGRASVSKIIEDADLTDTITFLTISQCGKYLVAADPSSNIVVWRRKNKKWTKYCKLPKYRYPPTALGIQPKTLYLVVSYSDTKLVEYSIKEQHFTLFSKYLDNNLPLHWKSRPYPIRNITFDSRKENIIILHDDSNIIIINKEKMSLTKSAKIPKKCKADLKRRNYGNQEIIDTQQGLAFYYIRKYKHLVHLSWLASDEIIALEVNPLSLIEQLPPVFYQSSFGQK